MAIVAQVDNEIFLGQQRPGRLLIAGFGPSYASNPYWAPQQKYFDGYQEQTNWQQKPSLLVVIGSGPVYNVASDPRRLTQARFFIDQDVSVITKSWQVFPGGGPPLTQDTSHALWQQKYFDTYQEFAQAQRPARIIWDVTSADIFRSNDTYGWPPDELPWFPRTPTSIVLLTPAIPYSPATDVIWMRQLGKYFSPDDTFFGPQPATLRRVDYYAPYNPATDPLLFRQLAKHFPDYAEFIFTKDQHGSLNPLVFYPYNYKQDVIYRRRNAIWFDAYQEFVHQEQPFPIEVPSPAPSPVTVPNVIGLNYLTAYATLTQSLIVSGVSTEYTSNIPAGIVISQSIPAGTQVPWQTQISYVYSLGIIPSGYLPMPNVIGLQLDETEAMLVEAGIVVPQTIGYFGTWPISVVFVSSNEPVWQVIGQSPAVGYPIAPNGAITLTVSQPPGSVAYPASYTGTIGNPLVN